MRPVEPDDPPTEVAPGVWSVPLLTVAASLAIQSKLRVLEEDWTLSDTGGAASDEASEVSGRPFTGNKRLHPSVLHDDGLFLNHALGGHAPDRTASQASAPADSKHGDTGSSCPPLLELIEHLLRTDVLSLVHKCGLIGEEETLVADDAVAFFLRYSNPAASRSRTRAKGAAEAAGDEHKATTSGAAGDERAEATPAAVDYDHAAMHWHYDHSSVTVDVCLHSPDGFEGGELLVRLSDVVGHAASGVATGSAHGDGDGVVTGPSADVGDTGVIAVPQVCGRALVFAGGRTAHAAAPVTSGERCNLVLWCVTPDDKARVTRTGGAFASAAASGPPAGTSATDASRTPAALDAPRFVDVYQRYVSFKDAPVTAATPVAFEVPPDVGLAPSRRRVKPPHRLLRA